MFTLLPHVCLVSKFSFSKVLTNIVRNIYDRNLPLLKLPDDKINLCTTPLPNALNYTRSMAGNKINRRFKTFGFTLFDVRSHPPRRWKTSSSQSSSTHVQVIYLFIANLEIAKS